ncbi:hypothetical protein G9A89_017826 [Geosiphon pyriformis]|nr:hypothetical protein G9A89_017826 [Geosiphon pyriformis]
MRNRAIFLCVVMLVAMVCLLIYTDKLAVSRDSMTSLPESLVNENIILPSETNEKVLPLYTPSSNFQEPTKTVESWRDVEINTISPQPDNELISVDDNESDKEEQHDTDETSSNQDDDFRYDYDDGEVFEGEDNTSDNQVNKTEETNHSENQGNNKKIPKPPILPIKSTLRPGGGPFPKPEYTIPEDSPPAQDGEKYLAYLVHGQFNNQQVSLRNALLLAKYLGRTLIIPPIIFGEKNPWKPFDILYKRITKLNKNGLEKCPAALKYSKNPPKECDNYNSWTKIQWDEFFNLKPFTEKLNITFILAEDFKLEWLKRRIGVKDKEIFFFKDNNPQGLRFYDKPTSQKLLGKFATRMDIDYLKKWPHKLLYFETLFSTGRVLSEIPENEQLRKNIEAQFVYTHPRVVSTANEIVERIGGKGAYVGMHVRMGDAKFLEHSNDTIRVFIENLQTVGKNYKNLHLIENHFNDSDFDEELDDQYRINSSPESDPQFNSAQDCLGRFDPDKNTLIYMATDLPSPRDNEGYEKLYEKYPCILTLSDFEIYLEKLKFEVNPIDSTPLKDFLIPMVDMIVAAKGYPFIQTHDSTFSKFAKILNEIYMQEDETK